MPNTFLTAVLCAASLAVCPAVFSADVQSSATPKPYTFAALVQNSPFKSVLKSTSFKPGNSASPKQVQFLGVLQIGGETEFGIYDPLAQRSYWLKLRERDNSGLYVESYNAEQKSVTLLSSSNGRMQLQLATPDEKPLNNASGSVYKSVASPVNTKAPQTQTNQTQQKTQPRQQRDNSGNARTSRQTRQR